MKTNIKNNNKKIRTIKTDARYMLVPRPPRYGGRKQPGLRVKRM